MKKVLFGFSLLACMAIFSGCEKESSGCDNSGNRTVCEACCIGNGQDFDLYDPVLDRCFCR